MRPNMAMGGIKSMMKWLPLPESRATSGHDGQWGGGGNYDYLLAGGIFSRDFLLAAP